MSAEDDDAAPEVALLSSRDSCPSATLVRGKLLQGMLKRYAVAPGEGSPDAMPVRIIDLGDRFDVTVGATSRVFSDPWRRCDERALTAAVFVALQLEGASIEPESIAPRRKKTRPSESEEPHAAASEVAPRGEPMPRAGLVQPAPVVTERPPERARHAWHLDLGVEASGGGTARWSDAGAGGVGGSGLRMELGWRHWGVKIGAAALGTSLARFEGTMPFSVTLFPLDLGVTGALRRGRWEGTLGLGALVLVAYAPSLLGHRAGLEPGLHAEVGGRIWLREWVALYAAFEADWTPQPIVLASLDGANQVGELSPYLLRLGVGAIFRLR